MKIAIIGTSYPYRGGLTAYNERLAVELQREGHAVTIFTFTLQYPDFLFPGKTQYSEEDGPKNLNIVRCINSINPFNWLSVGNRLKHQKPDLIIIKYWLPFMGPCFGTILRKIKKNRHSKIITIVDNIIPHEAKIGDRAFTRYYVTPVDGFVAMSQNVLEDIQQFDKSKPKILSPHPLFDNFGDTVARDEALTKLGLDPAYRYILFFGLVRAYKGLDLLLEAFADIRFRDAKIKLIIAGEYYSDRKVYTDLIKKYSLEKDIIQIDKFIQDSEVRYFFSACDLVVQPYKSATQSGITQIAYHFNKPMVVTDVGGLRELCPDGKVGYVTSTNPDEIAGAIIRFFQETDQEEMINNIIKEKKKYSWGVLIQNIFTLLDKIKHSQIEA
ncbi:MAG: glycosyl transferase family 1 [Bacteroides sp. SM1_62]|nr:MAG: glycosyl transferase family 1 [Bacteroides sp. SM23_62]KPL24325.1 MAG: glycosyl transferase family 1 [Bacteroides sp. SM1_62]